MINSSLNINDFILYYFFFFKSVEQIYATNQYYYVRVYNELHYIMTPFYTYLPKQMSKLYIFISRWSSIRRELQISCRKYLVWNGRQSIAQMTQLSGTCGKKAINNPFLRQTSIIVICYPIQRLNCYLFLSCQIFHLIYFHLMCIYYRSMLNAKLSK